MHGIYWRPRLLHTQHILFYTEICWNMVCNVLGQKRNARKNEFPAKAANCRCLRLYTGKKRILVAAIRIIANSVGMLRLSLNRPRGDLVAISLALSDFQIAILL